MTQCERVVLVLLLTVIGVMGPRITYVDHDSVTSLTHFCSLLMTRHTFRVDRA